MVDGDDLVALVQLRRPVDLAAVLARCGDRLGPDRTPDRIEVVASLPRLPNGKLLKRLLPSAATSPLIVHRRPAVRCSATP